MGFPIGSFVAIELSKPALLLLNLLIQPRLALVPVLRFLGFLRSLGDPSTSSSTIAPPSPSSIKNQLPVIEYVSLMKEEEHACMVCLEELDEREEFRKLGNCSHAFHTGCIDRWIDMGHRSCPLCRSQLLPVNDGKKGRRSLTLLPKIW